MPGTFNPVSSHPVSGVPQSKSFRTRLGFGSSTGAGPSTKPSFFSQLNLKPGRKSFGGPADFRVQDHPVLVIDPEPEYGGMPQENRVVLKDDTGPKGVQQNAAKSHSGSPSKATPSASKHNITHSLPASPFSTHIPSYSLNSRTDLGMSPVRGSSSGTRVDPDESGLSKHLPDLSVDLSLLMNEPPPPDTAFQSDHAPDSLRGPSVFYHGVSYAPSPGSSSASLEGHEQRRSCEPQTAAVTNHKLRPAVSSPQIMSNVGLYTEDSALSRSKDATLENTSASFDLSSARLSLDLMRQNLGEDWARSIIVEGNSARGVDVSSLFVPSGPLLASSGSGPVTSTPFRSPTASPSQSRLKEPEISFDLEALDPDLVALLLPNNYRQGQLQVNRIVTPSPLEPFAPPPDPLNLGTTINLNRPATTASPPVSPSSPHASIRVEKSTPSPVRKFATMSASTSPSPVRQLRIPRSYTAQDIFPHPHLPKPISSPTAQNDQTYIESKRHEDGQQSPSSLFTLSETETPLDASKQPSPLSAPPLTLNDLQCNSERALIQSSFASASTSSLAARRGTRSPMPTQIQSPVPLSVLTSSTDSRHISQYALRDRGHDLRPASASPEFQSSYTRAFGSTGRERERTRPPVRSIFSGHPSPEERPNTADVGRPVRSRLNSNAALPHHQDRYRDWERSAEVRHRKRSMSLDQSPVGFEGRRDDFHTRGAIASRSRPVHRDRMTESVGYGGSEYAYNMAGGLGKTYDGRDSDKDRERYGYGYGYGDRERFGRPHTDWLGPRTAKAFAAAGLLDDPRDAVGPRNCVFSRSTSERDFRTPASVSSRERRSPVSGGFPSGDSERDREHYSFAPSIRSSDRDHRSSSGRSGAISPSTVSATRPLSRGDSWSHSRPAPLFARTMSDLLSHRGSTEGRDSASGVYPRTGSTYSAGGGGGSTGSGGGRASPTTTSSLLAMQTQIQSIKDKHDAQTEALLAALVDSQRTSRELREENEALKSQVGSLEERLVEAIANSRQMEKELLRAMRTKPLYSPVRTRTAVSHRDADLALHSRPLAPSKQPSRKTPSPAKRRLSTSSSVFPTIPGSISLLMAETPGSPPQGSLGSLGSASSPPPSPTLVLPRFASKQNTTEHQVVNGHSATLAPASRPISMSHKRSTSGASVATSANFSFETGSPGSLKLRPEHELLLGDMTRLSLVTGFGGDSETEN